MNSWDIRGLTVEPHSPEILTSTDDARAIVLEIPAGESLSDHQVHERAWITVIDGEVEVTTEAGEHTVGGRGLMVEFEPHERHAVLARAKTRLLLLLTPWPGPGHPGALADQDRSHVRERAAALRAGS